jgi:hypothetical protein
VTVLSFEEKLQVYRELRHRVVPRHSNNYYIGISLLHDVHNFFSTSDTITAIKTTKKGVAEHVACMGKTNTSENVYGNPAGERQLGRSRRRWMILMWIFFLKRFIA